MKRRLLKEKSVNIVSILNEHKIANMNLKNLEEEKLTISAFFREYRWVERELQKLETDKKMLKESREDMSTKIVREPTGHSKTADRMLNSVESQFASLAMWVSRRM